MSNAVEYLFGPDLTLADAFARKKGWRPSGRAARLKRDGTTVYFICLKEQLARRARWRQGSQGRRSSCARRVSELNRITERVRPNDRACCQLPVS